MATYVGMSNAMTTYGIGYLITEIMQMPTQLTLPEVLFKYKWTLSLPPAGNGTPSRHHRHPAANTTQPSLLTGDISWGA